MPQSGSVAQHHLPSLPLRMAPCVREPVHSAAGQMAASAVLALAGLAGAAAVDAGAGAGAVAGRTSRAEHGDEGSGQCPC
jgi:hypothetical protein